MLNEKVKEIVKSQALEIMKALLIEYEKAPKGGEFREIFGSTMWVNHRQRPETFEQTINQCGA